MRPPLLPWNSLRDAAFQQLTTIRELRTNTSKREFAGLQQGVVLDSRNASAVEGAADFIDGFAKLQSSTLTSAQTAWTSASTSARNRTRRRC